MKETEIRLLLDIAITDPVDAEAQNPSQGGRPGELDVFSLLDKDTLRYIYHAPSKNAEKLTIIISNPLIGLNVYPLSLMQDVILGFFDYFHVGVWCGPNHILWPENSMEFWKLAISGRIVDECEEEIRKQMQSKVDTQQWVVLDIKRSRHLTDEKPFILELDDSTTGKFEREYNDTVLQHVDLDLSKLSEEEQRHYFYQKKINGIRSVRCFIKDIEWVTDVFIDLQHIHLYQFDEVALPEIPLDKKIRHVTVEINKKNDDKRPFSIPEEWNLHSLILLNYHDGNARKSDKIINLSGANIKKLVIKNNDKFSRKSINTLHLPNLQELALINIVVNEFTVPHNATALNSLYLSNIPTGIALQSIATKLQYLYIPYHQNISFVHNNIDTLKELTISRSFDYLIYGKNNIDYDYSRLLNLTYLRLNNIRFTLDNIPVNLKKLYLNHCDFFWFRNQETAQKIVLKHLVINGGVRLLNPEYSVPIWPPSIRSINIDSLFDEHKDGGNRVSSIVDNLFSLPDNNIHYNNINWTGEQSKPTSCMDGVTSATLRISQEDLATDFQFKDLESLVLFVDRFDDAEEETYDEDMEQLPAPVITAGFSEILAKVIIQNPRLDKLTLKINGHHTEDAVLRIRSDTLRSLNIFQDNSYQRLPVIIECNNLLEFEASNITFSSAIFNSLRSIRLKNTDIDPDVKTKQLSPSLIAFSVDENSDLKNEDLMAMLPETAQELMFPFPSRALLKKFPGLLKLKCVFLDQESLASHIENRLFYSVINYQGDFFESSSLLLALEFILEFPLMDFPPIVPLTLSQHPGLIYLHSTGNDCYFFQRALNFDAFIFPLHVREIRLTQTKDMDFMYKIISSIAKPGLSVYRHSSSHTRRVFSPEDFHVVESQPSQPALSSYESCYTENRYLSANSNTGTVPIIALQGTKKLIMYDGNGAPVSLTTARVRVSKHALIEQPSQQIVFESVLWSDVPVLLPLANLPPVANRDFKGFLSTSLQTQERCILPMFAGFILTSVSLVPANVTFQLLHYVDGDQYAIAVDQEVSELLIQYTCRLDAQFLSQHQAGELLPWTNQHGLASVIHQELLQVNPLAIIDTFFCDTLISPDTLACILLSPSYSNEEKLQILREFCRSFKQENLVHADHHDQTLFHCFRQKIGVCAHRADIFKLIADVLGIDTRVVESDKHAWVEIRRRRPDGSLYFETWDLGGGEATFAWDEAFTSLRLLAQNDLLQQARHKNSPVTEVDSDSDMKEYGDVMDTEFLDKRSVVHKKTYASLFLHHKTSDLDRLIMRSEVKRNLCISLPASVNSLQLFAALSQKVRSHGHSCLSARTYEQLVKLIVHTKRDDDLQLVDEEGILFHQLHRGLTYLFIDWSNMTANQRSRLQSILEGFDNVMGKQLPSENLRIISCLTQGKTRSPDFQSRLDEVELTPKDLESIQVESSNVIELSDPFIELDLFFSSDWQSLLLGKPQFIQGKIVIEPGPLIQAINTGKHLRVINVPNIPACTDFIAQLVQNRWFKYQDSYYDVPAGMKIECQERPLNVYKPACVELINDVSEKQVIYINANSWPELFSTVVLPLEPGPPETKPGLLAVYQSDHVLYITESIPADLWCRLTHYLENNPAIEKINMALCPGVVIDGLSQEVLPEASPSEAFPQGVIFSDDPIGAALEVKKKQPNTQVIYVSESTTYDELINQLNLQPGLRLQLTPTPLLQQLQSDSSMVVLAGALSEKIYQALLPFVLKENEKSFAWINGKLERIEGRVLLMLTNDCKRKLKPFAYYDDPTTLLERGSDLRDIVRLQKFIELVCQGPFADLSINTMRFTYLKLIAMQNALLRGNPLHRHNLLKGFFPDPIDERARAYYHVISKYCFQHSSSPHFNVKKWSAVVKRFSIDANPMALGEEDLKLLIEHHYWEVLNCFNDYFLVRLLVNSQEQVKEELFSRLQQQSSLYDLAEAPALITRREKFNQTIRCFEPTTAALVVVKENPDGQALIDILEIVKQRNTPVFQSSMQIGQWLKDGGALVIDNADYLPAGLFTFLQGVTLDTASVAYQNKVYDFSLSTHRLVLLCNEYPLNEAFFAQCAEYLVYKNPTEHELLVSIKQRVGDNENAQILFEVVNRIHEIEPFMPITESGIVSFWERYQYLITQDESNPFYRAIISEWAFCIKDIKHRTAFMLELQKRLNIEIKLPEEQDIEIIHQQFYASHQKIWLAHALREDVQMRNHYIENRRFPEMGYKNIIILEGESGLGKSTVFVKLLQDLGCSDDHVHLPKRYYKMSAGSFDFSRLEAIAAQESILILDEINLDPALIQLIQNLAKKYPGFMVLASQNGVHYAGRHGLSKELIASAHYLLMDDYTEPELQRIAQQCHVAESQAVQLVNGYQKARRENPLGVNPRNFFTVLSSMNGLKRERTEDNELNEDTKKRRLTQS